MYFMISRNNKGNIELLYKHLRIINMVIGKILSNIDMKYLSWLKNGFPCWEILVLSFNKLIHDSFTSLIFEVSFVTFFFLTVIIP